jgi:hypothetical protein
MKKNFLKYIFIIVAVISFIIFYLSIFGLETEKFNSQIKNKINQTDKNFEVELKKIRLTLSPLTFKVNAKTIAPKIFYKKKLIQLEYIETQISIISLIKNQIISSKLKLSTRSILLKDLVTFFRGITNRPELFILERAVKNGQIIVNLDLNFDETGKIKDDYKIKAILKDGKIGLLKKYNFEKINFSLNIHNNIFNFKDLNFTNSKSLFSSKNIKILQNEKDFFIEGQINNKDLILNEELLKLFKIDIKDIGFLNTNFNSNNKFSFSIDKKFKLKNLVLNSDIQVNESEYKTSKSLDNYLEIKDNTIKFKEHKIKSNFKNNKFTINGSGKIKLQEIFEDINYSIDSDDKDFKFNSKLLLSELNFNSQEYLKNFITNLDKTTTLKDQKIEINLDKKKLLINGQGKIKFNNDFEDIKFKVLKIKNKFNFNTELDLDNTPFKINFLNFVKNDKSKTRIRFAGSYEPENSLDFEDISIINENNRLIFKNIFLNKNNLIEKVDEVKLEFLDNQNKKNNILLKKIKQNKYQITGSSFNAEKLIDSLLVSKKDNNLKFFQNDIEISLNLKEIYLDNLYLVNDLNGNLDIKNNEIYTANISGDFDNVNNLKFTVNTNDVGEKITTLFSSKAKPLVERYKFIKGFEDNEEGYLDFYSSKKNGISNSKLIIDNFKVKEIPVLAKLLALASLQGIADLLTGEGIRFTDFEMNFTNKNKLMKIQELYAIGPAISILIEGYIEEDNLISLRGTLVPATTINRSIASIPLIGDLLIGKKAGEGVFGVSFKVKGPSKNLETTVNPIKTLTPRFITRTLEKIKKN